MGGVMHRKSAKQNAWPARKDYRRGGRAVECTGLENRQGFAPLGGSNPPLSAIRLRLLDVVALGD
jgi:hypothetical protein